MLITKIFHLRLPVDEARRRIRKFNTLNTTDSEVRCSVSKPDGVQHFDFAMGGCARLSTDIEEVSGDDPNRILFRSVSGDVELAGMVELFPIRPRLTELVLTLDYEEPSRVPSRMHKALEAIDRLLNRQLTRIEDWSLRDGGGLRLSEEFA